MSSAFKLSLPVDIPWRRICVTQDMVDRVVCDRNLPPKWHTSIAVFRYDPDDENQNYDGMTISYLKVAVTLTGYQPLADEIQGEIDWDGLDITTLDGVTESLETYHPCHGAIIQVVVGPPGRRPGVAVEDYPYFLDFEPKKRELYEQASDTQERQSRSTESLTLTKSAGTTKSLEVLDIDMGGSTSFGMQGSFAGTGGGFNYGSSSSGQWGTRALNSDQSMVDRKTELGTEKRETQSFTTQLSQLYHLLDAYHLGTNRAVFFVQPRPHVLEEPSGFVRGPRPVEGIQEFFLVVARPKDSKDFCVSVRVDTSHLTEIPVLDYELRTDVSDLAVATARIPTNNDIPDGTTTREACFFGCWDVTYNCFRTRDDDDQVYTAPTGFSITGYNDLVRESFNGSTSVSIAPGNKTLTVHAEADGHICFEGSGVCVDCPDEIEKRAGYARRQVQVNLRSDLPIRQVDTRQVMLITTRGLCCCDDADRFFDDTLVGRVIDIPVAVAGTVTHRGIRDNRDQGGWTSDATKYAAEEAVAPHAERGEFAHLPNKSARAIASGRATSSEGDDCGCGQGSGNAASRMTIRQANAIGDFMKRELVKSLNPLTEAEAPKPFIETDLFARKLEMLLRRTRRGRELLVQPLGEQLPGQVAEVISKETGKGPEDITAIDVLRYRGFDLQRKSGLDASEVAELKRRALGLRMRPRSRRGREKDVPEAPGE